MYPIQLYFLPFKIWLEDRKTSYADLSDPILTKLMLRPSALWWLQTNRTVDVLKIMGSLKFMPLLFSPDVLQINSDNGFMRIAFLKSVCIHWIITSYQFFFLIVIGSLKFMPLLLFLFFFPNYLWQWDSQYWITTSSPYFFLKSTSGVK